MSQDIPNHEAVNTLDVESSKKYKKHKQKEDTLNSNNDPNGNPLASSTPDKKKSNLKYQEPTSTLVAESYLSKNRLPRVPVCPGRYTPMLYTFRVPSYDTNTINMGKAQSPPFCLLLDNTIAVVWCLFSKSTCPKQLGICQLQWALCFLETIKNRRGEYPKDVGVCVNAMVDQLIELYADLVNELQSFYKRKGKEQKLKNGSKEAIDVAEKPSQSSKQKKITDVTLTESYIDRMVGSMPFSLNYNDIVNTSQKSTSAYGVNNTKSGKSINTQSRDQLVNFLSSWKQEQIDKIQSELQRLHSIENFIGNCEKGNFPSNMGDKELHVLLAEKNKRNNSV